MKREKFFKQNFVGFIIGGIIFGTLGVYAAITFPSNEVSFDPSNSTLKSTDVQGAIDELYTECTHVLTGGEAILDDVDTVTSGDGLYADEYEEGKYTYKGANPNNYVTFNNEKAGWRIISINSDGTIKIMRENSIGNQKWDTISSNNWNRPASLNTYLNGDYYNSLTSTAQSQIVDRTYYTGKVTRNNNDMQDQISDEKSVTSKLKVALPTLSEYIRAGSNTNCKTYSTYSNNYNTCKSYDWMFTSSSIWWTLSPYSGSSSEAFRVDGGGSIYYNGVYYNSLAVRPTVTLSSEVQITGGTGTESDPYQIE